MTFDDRLIISPTFYDIAKSQSFICIHMSGVLARKRQRDAMLTRYMHVDCTLISYYLAKKMKKEESVLKVKFWTIIVCCTILTHVSNCANIVSIQYS